MDKAIVLNKLQNTDFSNIQRSKLKQVLIFVCGYETRSLVFYKKIKEIFNLEDIYCIQLDDFDIHDFSKNNRTVIRDKLSILQYSNLIDSLKDILSKYSKVDGGVDYHIDYSSMPRSIYCRLPHLITPHLRVLDSCSFWYVPGTYVETDSSFPTAGIEDFKLFSGRSSLNPELRTHFIGLGFDKIRSQAIWTTLDPSNLVSFVADPAVTNNHSKKSYDANELIINNSKELIKLPVSNFLSSLSTLIDWVKSFHELGDVILVPDGPKPLVMASSLIPNLVGKPGITCFHVSNHNSKDYIPVNVKPINYLAPFGFKFYGNK